jgi:hypothetical protein
MVRIVGLLMAIGLLIGAGIVHGRWTDRWQINDDLQAATARLDRFPRDLGDWHGTDQIPEEQASYLAKGTRFVKRIYKKGKDGPVVEVLLLCGLPRFVTFHTPEACYGSQDFEMVGDRSRAQFGDRAELFQATFAKEAPVPRSMRVLWAWRAGDRWQASDEPRTDFAGHRALYKLYVARVLARGEQPGKDDPCNQFTKLLLRKMEEEMFAPPSKG